MCANFAPPLPQSPGNPCFPDLSKYNRATPLPVLEESVYRTEAYTEYNPYNHCQYTNPCAPPPCPPPPCPPPPCPPPPCAPVAPALVCNEVVEPIIQNPKYGKYKYDYNNFYLDDPNVCARDPRPRCEMECSVPALPPIVDPPPCRERVPRLNFEGARVCRPCSRVEDTRYVYDDPILNQRTVVNRRDVYDGECCEIEPTRVYVKRDPCPPPCARIIQNPCDPKPTNLIANAPFKAASNVLIRGAGVNVPAKYYPSVNYYPPGALPPARNSYSQLVHPCPGELPFNLGGASFY